MAVNIVQMSSNNGGRGCSLSSGTKGDASSSPSDLLVAQRCFFPREYRALKSADIGVQKKGRERVEGSVILEDRIQPEAGDNRRGGRLCAARNNRREAVP